jgi:two-component system, OmpR family, response regulator
VRRILIVDDEPSVRDVMATVLIDAGYSVQTAADGHIALEIIDDAPPDLIITDVMMPHLDGWALLDHARERDPALPVILMSAGDWIRARRMMPMPDHAVFLAKPFAIEELLALVMRLTDSQSN